MADRSRDAEFAADAEDELLTGEAVALDLRPVGFVLRAAGTIIDFVVHAMLFIVVVIGMSWAAASAGAEEAVLFALGIASFVLAFVIAPMTVETATRGRSLGRLAIGGRIVRDDGGAIGLRHAAIRALVGVLEFPLTLGGVAVITALLSPRTKRLGDLLAGTYCQSERISAQASPLFGVPTALVAWASVADVARLPDALSRRVSRFLDSATQFEPDRRGHLARELASEVSAFVFPIPDADPELFLAATVVVRRDREAAALRLEHDRLARLGPALTSVPHGFPERG